MVTSPVSNFETDICEVCGTSDLELVLRLGSHPLCDDLVPVGQTRKVLQHPQEILLCHQCLTAHQRFQVPKETLFPSDYHYRSRLTVDVLNGMQQLVNEVLESHPPVPGAKVLDIGCNDGSLLTFFHEQGLETVGVDPTDAIQEAGDQVDYAYQNFFDDELADLLAAKHGHFDYIVMTNVFAHIENFPQLCENLKKVIGPNTVLVIENHYLGSIVGNNQFDTFYHEHPRTYSARSFECVAIALNCGIESISFPSRYGGNIRVILSRRSLGNDHTSIDESHLPEAMRQMQSTFEQWKQSSQIILNELAGVGLLAGKALPGRAVMLINSLGITSELMSKIYEKPGSPKIGHYVPGTQIQIVSDSELLNSGVTDLIVWAWHIADEVIEYIEQLGYKGKVWVPLPEFRMLHDFS